LTSSRPLKEGGIASGGLSHHPASKKDGASHALWEAPFLNVEGLLNAPDV